jgi:hypothetical protein
LKNHIAYGQGNLAMSHCISKEKKNNKHIKIF